MQVLMEMHEERKLDMLHDYLDIVGVNNRNLFTFEVDLRHSAKLANLITEHFLKISESGISSSDDIYILKKLGFRGFKC